MGRIVAAVSLVFMASTLAARPGVSDADAIILATASVSYLMFTIISHPVIWNLIKNGHRRLLMSDQAERERILTQLGEAWAMQPDMRLGQLISSFATVVLAPGMNGVTADKRAMTQLFYIKDGDLVHNLLLWGASHERS